MSDIVIQNVTDTIGDAYKTWEPGSKIIIPSYVGSGKTHYIIHELAKSADEKNKIVYLCNRKALLDQVLKKNGERIVDELNEEYEQDCYVYNKNVYILSYQYCETTGKFPNIEIPKSKIFPILDGAEREDYTPDDVEDEKIKIHSKDVRFFVFDEAHYFAVDSAFNKNCSFWASKFSQLNNSVSIFMTATPEPLYCFLEVCDNSFLEYDIKNEYISRDKTKNNIKAFLEQWKKQETDYKKRKANAQQSNPKVTPVTKTMYTVDDISVTLRYLSEGDSIFRELSKNDLKTGEQMEKSEYWDYICNVFSQTNDDFKLYSFINRITAEIIEKYNEKYEEYKIDRSYVNYNCCYFQDYEDLYNLFVRVVETKKGEEITRKVIDDRFVIFVDSEADGYLLEGVLNAICTLQYEQLSSEYYSMYSRPYAVFLSKKTIEKKRSAAYREYKNIIDNEQFNCKILITTKILDCGVNISQKCDVKNIVITQSNKTEFIQMLGRVRTIDHTKSEKQLKDVNLYIRSILPKTIREGSLQRIQDISTAINFLKTPKDKRGQYYSYLKRHMLSPIIKVGTSEPESNEKPELSIDKAYLARCIYEIYLYYGFLCRKKEFANPKTGYLIEQLKWIGKEYEPDKWVMVQERKKEIEDKMDTYLGIDRSNDKQAHLALKAFILERILRFPDCIMPDSFLQRKPKIKESLENYKKSLFIKDSKKTRCTIINDKTLNEVLKYLGIPYKLFTWKANSKNWWRVEKSSEE